MSLVFEEKVSTFLDLLRLLAQLSSFFSHIRPHSIFANLSSCPAAVILQQLTRVNGLGRIKTKEPLVVSFSYKYLEECVSANACRVLTVDLTEDGGPH